MSALDQGTYTLTLKVSTSWWLKLYIDTLVTLCRLTGMGPNWKRVDYWLNKGIKVKVVK